MKCHRHKEVEAAFKVKKGPVTREVFLCAECKPEFEEIQAKWRVIPRQEYERDKRDGYLKSWLSSKTSDRSQLEKLVQQVMRIYDAVVSMEIVPI